MRRRWLLGQMLFKGWRAGAFSFKTMLRFYWQAEFRDRRGSGDVRERRDVRLDGGA